MKREIKLSFKKHLWFLIALQRMILRRKSYLHVTGWVESIKRGYPCDKDGSELPWMVVTAVRLSKPINCSM